MAGRVINLAKFLGPAGEATGAFKEALTYATSHGVAAYKLPDLPYGYSALEPVISGQIMELHHSKHHAAYVTNLNKALEQYAEAEQKQDLQTMISLQSAINFNGGGGCTCSNAVSPSVATAATPAVVLQVTSTMTSSGPTWHPRRWGPQCLWVVITPPLCDTHA
jgi:hypothetical protein